MVSPERDIVVNVRGESNTPSEPDEREFIAQELARVLEAGNALAAAAHYVSAHFDGVHRLRLALAGWYTALANEGGRGQ